MYEATGCTPRLNASHCQRSEIVPRPWMAIQHHVAGIETAARTALKINPTACMWNVRSTVVLCRKPLGRMENGAFSVQLRQ